MCRSGNAPNITRVVGWYYSSKCHPEGAKRVEGFSRVAGFILWWFIFQRGGFLHSADAPVGMTYLRGGFVYPRRLFLQRPPERHTGRSLRFRWWVDSFNRTGCICNVAGGRLPKKSWCDCPGNHYFLIRCAEHHPCMRNTIHTYRLHSERGVVPFWAVFFLHIHFTMLLPFRGFRLYMGAV